MKILKAIILFCAAAIPALAISAADSFPVEILLRYTAAADVQRAVEQAIGYKTSGPVILSIDNRLNLLRIDPNHPDAAMARKVIAELDKRAPIDQQRRFPFAPKLRPPLSILQATAIADREMQLRGLADDFTIHTVTFIQQPEIDDSYYIANVSPLKPAKLNTQCEFRIDMEGTVTFRVGSPERKSEEK